MGAADADAIRVELLGAGDTQALRGFLAGRRDATVFHTPEWH